MAAAGSAGHRGAACAAQQPPAPFIPSRMGIKFGKLMWGAESYQVAASRPPGDAREQLRGEGGVRAPAVAAAGSGHLRAGRPGGHWNVHLGAEPGVHTRRPLLRLSDWAALPLPSCPRGHCSALGLREGRGCGGERIVPVVSSPGRGNEETPVSGSGVETTLSRVLKLFCPREIGGRGHL